MSSEPVSAPSSAQYAVSSKPVFQWDDAFLLEDQLSEEERMIRDTDLARKFEEQHFQQPPPTGPTGSQRGNVTGLVQEYEQRRPWI